MKRFAIVLLLLPSCSAKYTPNPNSSYHSPSQIPDIQQKETEKEQNQKHENVCNVGEFSSDVPEISVTYLIQKMEDFHKKRIRMFGFIQIEGEDTTFVSSRWDHWTKSLKFRPTFAIDGRKLKSCNRKDVEIEAVFRLHADEHGGIDRFANGYLEIFSIRELHSKEPFEMPNDIVRKWNERCPDSCEKELERMGGQIVEPNTPRPTPSAPASSTPPDTKRP